MLISQYSKAEAMSREDRLIAGHKKLYGKKRKPKRPPSIDYHNERLQGFVEGKAEILSLCTESWQGSRDFADVLGLPPTTTLGRMKRLVEEGRIEGRKYRGKVQVRLPQGKSGEQPDV